VTARVFLKSEGEIGRERGDGRGQKKINNWKNKQRKTVIKR